MLTELLLGEGDEELILVVGLRGGGVELLLFLPLYHALALALLFL